MAKREFYRIHTQTGSIVDERGGILYEPDSIKDLSLVAKIRLAQLHSIYPDLQWEGSIAEQRKGAWDFLIEEGLMQ